VRAPYIVPAFFNVLVFNVLVQIIHRYSRFTSSSHITTLFQIVLANVNQLLLMLIIITNEKTGIIEKIRHINQTRVKKSGIIIS
jgi:hypothetical protein